MNVLKNILGRPFCHCVFIFLQMTITVLSSWLLLQDNDCLEIFSDMLYFCSSYVLSSLVLTVIYIHDLILCRHLVASSCLY